MEMTSSSRTCAWDQKQLHIGPSEKRTSSLELSCWKLHTSYDSYDMLWYDMMWYVMRHMDAYGMTWYDNMIRYGTGMVSIAGLVKRIVLMSEKTAWKSEVIALALPRTVFLRPVVTPHRCRMKLPPGPDAEAPHLPGWSLVGPAGAGASAQHLGGSHGHSRWDDFGADIGHFEFDGTRSYSKKIKNALDFSFFCSIDGLLFWIVGILHLHWSHGLGWGTAAGALGHPAKHGWNILKHGETG